MSASGRTYGAARRIHLAFVMEQHLGHRTYSDNLRHQIEARDDITATWIPIDYAATDSWWERIARPVSIRGVLRGRAEVDHGLEAGDTDVRVYNTQVPAVIGGRRARMHPYVLCTDVTPIQYDAMAAGYGHRADRAGPARWLKHQWNGHVFRGAAAHAPWSDWVRRSLIADYGVDAGSIEVIAPGIETSAWSPADHAGGGPMKILFVGGDFHRKGGQLLLDAVAALPTGSAEVRVVTRSAVNRRPDIEVFHSFSQNDPQLKELYRTSDVFVLPSASEAFGIAAVEAAAAGLPVVVSSVGGLAGLVVDGVTGLAMAPGDLDGLIGNLRRLADHPMLRREMGRAGRKRAEAEFDAATNADRLVRLAVNCLGARS